MVQCQKLISRAKFSLGQFYVAKTRSYGRIVSGKILGNYNLSFARTRQAPPDVGGLLQHYIFSHRNNI